MVVRLVNLVVACIVKEDDDRIIVVTVVFSTVSQHDLVISHRSSSPYLCIYGMQP